MSLRFCSLGSGSRGNALLVESGATLLMIDCGLSRKTLEQRMRSVGRSPDDITAVLVTHEHSDHVQGIGPLLRRYAIPIWMTPGTAAAIDYAERFEPVNSHRRLTIGAVVVEPFPVPHDAREPCQYVFSAGGRRLGLLTDTGHVTRHVRERLTECDALAVEFNHDTETLRRGGYPPSVKARVASDFGHLNNAQAAGLLRELTPLRLQRVVAMHISERNNAPELVADSVADLVDRGDLEFSMAAQDSVTAWIDID